MGSQLNNFWNVVFSFILHLEYILLYAYTDRRRLEKNESQNWGKKENGI